jgi:hypothetical protein
MAKPKEKSDPLALDNVLPDVSTVSPVLSADILFQNAEWERAIKEIFAGFDKLAFNLPELKL